MKPDTQRSSTTDPDIPGNRQVGGTHYVDMLIQPWDAMKVWMTPEQYIGYHKGAIIGYVARCDSKGGLEDIKKAHHHMRELISYSEKL